jgi:predicted metalloendopeptidase
MTKTLTRLGSVAGALLLAWAIGGPARAQAPDAASTVHGIDVAGMDRSVKPGDDFFTFANGSWIRNTAIPEDRASWGIFAMLDDQATLQTRTILETAGRTPRTADERKIGDYYAAFMDDAAIEKRGLTPIQPLLDRIGAVADRRALARLLGSMLRADVDPLNATNYHTDNLFGLWVAQDFNQPTRNTAYLLQGGIAMPDREYYVGESPRMADIRTKYLAHVTTVLKLAGASEADAAARAQRIVALETKIARAHATREQSIDVLKANNPWPRAEFATRAPGIDWSAYFQAANLTSQPAFIVWHPGAVTGESALVASEPLDDWKEYLRYIVINHWSGLLPKPFADERFAFFGTTLSGTPKQAERWKRGVATTSYAMGDAVGRLYVQQHFPPESKKAAEAMVADIKAAFAQRIDRLDWMSPETRTKAKQKLQTLIVGVGYPDKWRDYSALTISRDDALGNAMRVEAFEYRYRVDELSKPIDRHEWWMTPQTVNAVNLPIQNALNFPAAILQPPYFDPKASVANNYGAIGAIIGHEISHSFDDQGSQFDASGKLANWWTPQDFEHFRSAADKLVAQYNAYKPFPDLSVNGKQTLSENIADVAGLSASYDAYRLSLHGKELPPQDGFTGDQQFFISYGQAWRDKYREPMLRRIVVTDGHAPSMYRAQTVRNLDPWYAAFDVQPGAALFLAPGDRVRIW